MKAIHSIAASFGIFLGMSAAVRLTSLPDVHRPQHGIRQRHRDQMETNRRAHPELNWPDRSHMLPDD